MKHLTIDFPDTLELNKKDVKRFLVAKMYETGKLSLGQAAELAGLFKITFAEILSDYDVSFINYSISDILKDAAKF